MNEKIEFYKWPAITAIVFLILSFLDWPYGYYTFMKFIVTGSTIYYAYYIYEQLKKQDFWFWILVGIAILFNPIVPIHLGDKDLWSLIDIVVIVFLVSLMSKLKNKKITPQSN